MNLQIVSPSGLVYNTFNNVVNIDTSDISECASVTETLSVSVSTDSSSAPSASSPSASAPSATASSPPSDFHISGAYSATGCALQTNDESLTAGFQATFYNYLLLNDLFDYQYIANGYTVAPIIGRANRITNPNYSLGLIGSILLSGIYNQVTVAAGLGYVNELTGYFYAKESGTYTFNLNNVDDAAMVWFGNNDAFTCCQPGVIPGGSVSGALLYSYGHRVSVNVDLEAGNYYPMRVVLLNVVGTSELDFSVITPAGTVLHDDWTSWVFSIANTQNNVCDTSEDTSSSITSGTPSTTAGAASSNTSGNDSSNTSASSNTSGTDSTATSGTASSNTSGTDSTATSGTASSNTSGAAAATMSGSGSSSTRSTGSLVSNSNGTSGTASSKTSSSGSIIASGAGTGSTATSGPDSSSSNGSGSNGAGSGSDASNSGSGSNGSGSNGSGSGSGSNGLGSGSDASHSGSGSSGSGSNGSGSGSGSGSDSGSNGSDSGSNGSGSGSSGSGSGGSGSGGSGSNGSGSNGSGSNSSGSNSNSGGSNGSGLDQFGQTTQYWAGSVTTTSLYPTKTKNSANTPVSTTIEIVLIPSSSTSASNNQPSISVEFNAAVSNTAPHQYVLGLTLLLLAL